MEYADSGRNEPSPAVGASARAKVEYKGARIALNPPTTTYEFHLTRNNGCQIKGKWS